MHAVFLYDNNTDQETVIIHKKLLDEGLFEKMTIIPTGNTQTKFHLLHNQNRVVIRKMPCLLIERNDGHPKIYYYSELDSAIKALHKFFQNKAP